MLLVCSFCPHPPLLIPAVAGAAAVETGELLAACDNAVDALVAAAPDVIVVLGVAPTARCFDTGQAGTLRGWGVPVVASLAASQAASLAAAGDAVGPPELPLPLTVGAWLLNRSGYAGPRRGRTVTGAEDRAELGRIAGQVIAAGDTVAVLAMGDGSASRTAASPGGLRGGAVEFDSTVMAALGSGNAGALAALDPILGASLLAGGVPVWRLAGVLFDGGVVHARLDYDQAPFGVAYPVATWSTR